MKKMKAKVTTDRPIKEMSMDCPVYRDVSLLLWESMGQQIINFAAMREKENDRGEWVYSIDIEVRDLNDDIL